MTELFGEGTAFATEAIHQQAILHPTSMEKFKRMTMCTVSSYSGIWADDYFLPDETSTWRILIKGNTGSGKTILFQQYAHGKATGAMLQEYDLVILLKLNNKQQTVLYCLQKTYGLRELKQNVFRGTCCSDSEP